MAGGIDWFRWHHGSVTDPKFGLVARKAGARLGDVLAVWAFVLESASANDERGIVGPIDFESLDFLLGMDDGTAMRILDAMTARGLLGVGGVVTAWEKRQPKREREGDNSTERVRALRERQRQETPRNAKETPETPRGEESREEKSRGEKREKTARKRARAPTTVEVPELVSEGVQQQHAEDWIAIRSAKGLPLTRTAWDETKAEAAKAGLPVGEAIRVAAGNGWAGFRASWQRQQDSPHINGSKAPNRQLAIEAINRSVAAEWLKQGEPT